VATSITHLVIFVPRERAGGLPTFEAAALTRIIGVLDLAASITTAR